jgi:hypothetical protein
MIHLLMNGRVCLPFLQNNFDGLGWEAL